tara:strand:+ start:195 stop:503 length:309 start_codon:yes stop_codon:yes gene_type:complete
MMKIKFLPSNKEIEKPGKTKILIAARHAKAKIRFGCAACSCGLCAVLITKGSPSPMSEKEEELLKRIGIFQENHSVRLSCQARVDSTDLEVDLDFQDTYSPE